MNTVNFVAKGKSVVVQFDDTGLKTVIINGQLVKEVPVELVMDIASHVYGEQNLMVVN